MLDKRNIGSLEQWAKIPFANEAEWLEAINDPECSNKYNPVYALCVQAKLRLPFTDDMRSRSALSKAYKESLLPAGKVQCDCKLCREARTANDERDPAQ